MKEEWKLVGGHPNYVVSNYGRVFSITSKRLLTQFNNGLGYVYVTFRVSGGGRKNMYVHRLVASSFIHNPEDKPQVNHKDGNKSHNHVTNLEWVTAKENQRHSVNIGTYSPTFGETNGMHKLKERDVIEILKRLSVGERVGELAKEYGVRHTAISRIKTGTRWAFLKDAA